MTNETIIKNGEQGKQNSLLQKTTCKNTTEKPRRKKKVK